MIKKGVRYLLCKKKLKNPEEHFILEISASGKYFKTRLIDGYIKWEVLDKYEILEELEKIPE
jgi:hypothetical protein